METLHAFSRRRFLAASAGAAAVAAVSKSQAAAEPVSAWQIGIYTRPWAQHDYRIALDAMAEAGFNYAGLMTGKNGDKDRILTADTTEDEALAIGEEARKRGLKIASVYGAWSLGRSAEESVKSLRRLIDNVAAARGGSLLMGGVGKPEQQEPYYNAIKQCCDYAAEKGISITVKPHGGQNATGAQCRKCVEQVGHKNFGLTYDPGNIFFYSDGKLDPVEDAAAVDGLVRSMCVKDYLPPKRVDVTPGTGKVNFPAVLARLRKGGFNSGPLVIECLAPGDLKQTLAEAQKARQFVESLVKA